MGEQAAPRPLKALRIISSLSAAPAHCVWVSKINLSRVFLNRITYGALVMGQVNSKDLTLSLLHKGEKSFGRGRSAPARGGVLSDVVLHKLSNFIMITDKKESDGLFFPPE